MNALLALFSLPLFTASGSAPFEGATPGSTLDALRRELVPADARLVLHFDMQGFQRTELWKALSAPGGPIDVHADLEDLEELKTAFGIDPFTDLLGVTVWSSKDDLEPEAAVIVTTANVDQALSVLRLQPGYRSDVHEGLEFHTLREKDFVAYLHPLHDGLRAVVLAESHERLLRAARVVRGESPSLAGARNTRLEARPSPGSFLFGALVGGLPRASGFEPASHILGLAQGIQFDLGEAGGSLFMHLAISSESAETAKDLADAVNGILAMLRIAVGSQPEMPAGVNELMRALRVAQVENAVTLDFQYSTSGLLELLRSLEALESCDDEDDDGDDHREVRVEIREDN